MTNHFLYRRREFIALLCGAATWPFAARAQQSALVIGFMSTRSSDDSAYVVAAFRRGLSDEGFMEGCNVSIEFRWAGGRYEEMPAIAAELVSRQVTVLVAVGGEPSALAAKAATSAIPIVFTAGGDPVKSGCQSQSAGWKRHGHQPADHCTGGEAARVAPRVGPARGRNRRADQSEGGGSSSRFLAARQ